MESKIIPFGKYKGQPLEVLQNDLQYLDWLRSQDWFKTTYPQINTIIINNFKEPDETPEHNKLQMLFLDDSICKKLFIHHFKIKGINLNEEFKFDSAIFENKGIDVTFCFYTGYRSGYYLFKLEIKPNLGDDYPAILRQMINNDAQFLIADTFTALGATLDQVKELFKRSNKSVYLFNEFI